MDSTKDRDTKTAKRKLVAVKDFNDKNGQAYKLGQRFEVDPEYGQELIRRGDANDDAGNPTQLPADQQHGDRGAHASQPIADKDKDQKHRDSK